MLFVIILQELLGLGLDIPGMPSKGTLDKPDALPSTMMRMAMAEEEEEEENEHNRRRRSKKKASPVKLLSVKPVPEEEEEEDSEDSDEEFDDEDEEDDEEGSDILNASVVSSVVDRYFDMISVKYRIVMTKTLLVQGMGS